MTLEKPFRISEADPVKVHTELAKQHGQYDRFEEMMRQYNDRIMHLDITGAINVIITYREDMQQTNRLQYFPIIDTLNERLTDWALAIARSGGGAR